MQSHEDIARKAATILAAELDPALPAFVEGQLRAGVSESKQYLEPGTTIALAALIVNVAGLAWTIYRDLRKETPTPTAAALKSRVRVQLEEPQGLTLEHRDRIVEVVVEQLTH
jgi:hypothetical protein